jgi:hypothetical protein
MTVIELSDFEKNISTLLGIDITKRDLIPNTLVGWLQMKNTDIVWHSIQDWEFFESGSLDWAFDEFLNIIQYKEGDALQIMTDATYRLNEAIIFNNTDRDAFENTYADRYDQEFFQPLDYILIRNGNQIMILHHEGQILFI